MNVRAWTLRILDSDLPTMSRAVALVLCRYQEPINPSQAVLAKQTGMGRSTLNRALNVLESEGWIARKRGDSAHTTQYFLRFPERMNYTPKQSRCGTSKGDCHA